MFIVKKLDVQISTNEGMRYENIINSVDSLKELFKYFFEYIISVIIYNND